jgi:BirA family biotin operon repressor/biotin-[acetyl-CoA-carboxylase] ligase
MTQRLSADLIRRDLATHTFGQHLVYVAQIGSTNTELKKLAQEGAPEGFLYLTDEQVAGRGRLNRGWYAPPGSSLMMSLLFRPGGVVAPHQAQRLTMLCALSMADAIEAQTGLAPALKWPNDLVWRDGRKLAGVLTELGFEGNDLAWAIVGIGLNVNLDFAAMPVNDAGENLAQRAVSLSMLLGREVDRRPLLQQFLVNVEQRYEGLRQGRLFHQEWRARLLGLGQPITVTDPKGVHQGLLEDVDENGAVLLRQPDGTLLTVLAGDVTLRTA